MNHPFARAWDRFFFRPEPPTPIALFRIAFGLLVSVDLLILYPDWLTWFGENGVLPMSTLRDLAPGPHLGLFPLLPSSDLCVAGFFWILLLSSAFLTAGFCSRTSSVAVFLGLASIHQRNPYILNAGDSLLRVTAFFLMFAPSGAALSIDSLIRSYRRTGSPDATYAPWARRMIQIQTSIIYIATFAWKIRGHTWRNGTALYYALQLSDYRRFPVPGMQHLSLVHAATWAALAVEFAMGVLVWIKKIRYGVLLAGLLLHLSIEYSMNLPLFEWSMMACYITFVDPADLRRFWLWMRSAAMRGTRLRVPHYSEAGRARRQPLT